MKLFFLVFFLTLLPGCFLRSKAKPDFTTQAMNQEPIIRQTVLLNSGNSVFFGNSIASVASQDEALAYIDGIVNSRLPGVRFYIVHYPVVLPPGFVGSGPGGIVLTTGTSYRAPTENLIVLSWWGREGRPGKPGTPLFPSGWTVGDVPWEVNNLVAGTDDDGRPWNWRQ